MKVAFFNTKNYDKRFFEEANVSGEHEIQFLEPHLTPQTALLAYGYEAICAFVNDQLTRPVLEDLAEHGLKLIALRCAGFNNVDLEAVDKLGLTVLRVPAYSPQGVAEHAVALMLALNRKVYRSYNRIRDGNFSLEGLLGFDMNGKTVGVMGTGTIGTITARILQGFHCRILAYDPYPNEDLKKDGVHYVDTEELFHESDIITLHMPLMHSTYHIINKMAIQQMKKGVMIINTSRGGLIDTQAVINGLKSERIGYLGLDVYEEEGDLFFEDLSGHVIQDDVFARLLTFPNVMVTGHQAFFTVEALRNIAETTIANVNDFEKGEPKDRNRVTLDLKRKKK